MTDANSPVPQIVDGLEPGSFVTKFVLVAETISPDGERCLWTQTADDATKWDTYGLLTYALNEEASSQTAATWGRRVTCAHIGPTATTATPPTQNAAPSKTSKQTSGS